MKFQKEPTAGKRSWVFLCACGRSPPQKTYMSKTTQTETKKTTKRAELGPTMSGSEILVACLEREGVDTIFAYPGGASMEIHQALTRSTKIPTIQPRHEQSAAVAAEGH